MLDAKASTLYRWRVCAASLGFSLLGCRGPSAEPQLNAGKTSTVPGPSGAIEDGELEGDELHGRLEVRDGQRILHLWGTPREMGFAHGHLLRAEILSVLDGYALEVLGPAAFDAGSLAFSAAAQISDARREEAEALVAGMHAAGGARSESLARDLLARDILFVNALTDVLAVGCSSVSAWGERTQGDADLAGAPVIVRNLDWSDDPQLLESQLLIAYAPSEPGARKLVSVAFAGYLGCLSCMNEDGVVALFNMGYGEGAATRAQAMAGFAPANLAIRDALESGDANHDGHVSADEVEAELRARQHAGSWILHLLEPRATGRDPARVLEIEAKGVRRRDPESKSALGAQGLAATNHLRVDQLPRPGRRWRHIEREAARLDAGFDRSSLWRLGEELALPEVVHTILVEPESRRLRVALRQPGQKSPRAAEAADHEWAQLFAR